MESQDAAATFLLKLWPQIEANKNKIATVAAIVIGIGAIVSFVSWRHTANQTAAGDALTQTLITIPPTSDPARLADAYLAVASDYAGTPAADRALLQGAASLFAEGKYTDAQGYFQKYLEAHPDADLSGPAALGVAKCLEAQNKLNDASGEYQHIINDLPDPQAVIAAKFALAQIDVQQRNYANASQLFGDVARADPYGPTGQEAAQYLLELRSKTPPAPVTMPSAAPSPAPAAGQPSPFNLSH